MWSTEILLLIGLAPVHQKRARTDEAREYFVFIWHRGLKLASEGDNVVVARLGLRVKVCGQKAGRARS